MFISKIKAFAVAVVVVGSVAAGAGTAWRAAAAQRGAPGGLAGVPNAEAAQDPKKKEQDATPNQFSIDVPPLPKTPTPSDLLALRKALLKAAKTWVEVAEDQFDAGHITMNRYLDASMGLLDAELALAADQASRMAADRGHYDRLKRIVARATAEFEFGQRSIGDLAECQHALIKAEIRLCECQLEEVKK